MSCHEAEIASCSESFHMEQAGVIADVADCIALVLNVCSVPMNCLLTPLMSPKHKKCKLLDRLID